MLTNLLAGNSIDILMSETRDNGGTTVSLTGEQIPTTGYMVGGFVDSLIFDAKLLSEFEHYEMVWEQISQWTLKNAAAVMRTGSFVGGWIDKETGQAYVDLSVHMDSKRNALLAASIMKETAIWDLANNEEIRVS
jgi:hypothetical protein